MTLALNNVVEDLDGDGVEDHYDNDDDGDGFSDTIEIAYGSDPRNASSVANAAPSSLDLNASSVPENNPQDSVIGSLIASDPDVNASLSLSLSAGNGSTHNTLFRIDSSNQLRILSSLDFETDASTYSIRVRATDQYGFSLDQVFAISLTNVVEDLDGDGIEDHYDADDDGDGFSDTDEIVYGSDPRNPNSVANAEPDSLSLTNSSFLENSPIGTVVGNLQATDPDANASFSYQFANGQGSDSNGFFSVDSDGTLCTATHFDFESNSTALSIRMRVTDQHGAYFEEIISLTLLNQNESPHSFVSLQPLQVSENLAIGSLVGQLQASDPDAQTTLNFTLVEGSLDNSLFNLDANGTLRTATVLDYETLSELTIRAKVRDPFNSWIKENFEVQVMNVIEDLDGDGIEDFYDSDDDGDGFSDAEEIAYGSDPRDLDSVANTAPRITLADNNPALVDVHGVYHHTHTENQTHVLRVTADDADGDDLNYSIYGWYYMDLFEINATTGDLSFKTTPDYETPTDNHQAGVYGIMLQ